jgi:hypothetical protein
MSESSVPGRLPALGVWMCGGDGSDASVAARAKPCSSAFSIGADT